MEEVAYVSILNIIFHIFAILRLSIFEKDKHDLVEGSSGNAGETPKSRMKYYPQLAHLTADFQSQEVGWIISPSPRYGLNHSTSAQLCLTSGNLLGHSTICIVNGRALLSRHTAFSLSQLTLTRQKLLSFLIDLALHLDFNFSKLLFLAT